MMLLYIFVSTFQDQFYVNWLASFLKEAKGFDNETMGLFALAARGRRGRRRPRRRPERLC